eukprot:TRINITY_DN4418_c1_g1_i9.p1 TRINITY_DN4418_c1_g1~~TRINITY_DN4418_c1_g1_i9.p1  ORF type:complete len:209 (-),score=59.28 TRINITY_DN4418_c1_g1_i9:230-856(-)
MESSPAEASAKAKDDLSTTSDDTPEASSSSTLLDRRKRRGRVSRSSSRGVDRFSWSFSSVCLILLRFGVLQALSLPWLHEFFNATPKDVSVKTNNQILELERLRTELEEVRRELRQYKLLSCHQPSSNFSGLKSLPAQVQEDKVSKLNAASSHPDERAQNPALAAANAALEERAEAAAKGGVLHFLTAEAPAAFLLTVAAAVRKIQSM